MRAPIDGKMNCGFNWHSSRLIYVSLTEYEMWKSLREPYIDISNNLFVLRRAVHHPCSSLEWTHVHL